MKKTFTDQIQRRLAEPGGYAIEAGGDTLAFSRMDFEVERLGGRVNTDKMKDLVDDAGRLFGLFKGSRS